jgi:myo-inositol-1(or 4)-monophosphatase
VSRLASVGDREERIAVAAALAGADVVRRAFRGPHRVRYKTVRDIVTDVDGASEEVIRSLLAAADVGYGMLAEESGEVGSANDSRWIVDPLDGTVNFSRGLPRFCVSVALERSGDIVLGVVVDPIGNELFVARLGQGATLNGRPISVSKAKSWARAVVSTGFPSGLDRANAEDGAVIASIASRVLAVRSTGSAALDLAYVACGRHDAHWERGLYPYDVAAGALLVSEAGGIVTDYRGDQGPQGPIYGKEIVAAGPALHARLVGVLRRETRLGVARH